MSTKIGGFDGGPVQVSTDRGVKRAGDAGSAVAGSVGTQTETTITDTARKMAALEQTILDLPAVDEARVQQVTARLANGSYEVNAERIADKLLRTEQELPDLN